MKLADHVIGNLSDLGWKTAREYNIQPRSGDRLHVAREDPSATNYLHSHVLPKCDRNKFQESCGQRFRIWQRMASLYVGYPNIFRVDQGNSYPSELLGDESYAHYITPQFSGTESHNYIGVGEKYHPSQANIQGYISITGPGDRTTVSCENRE